MSIGLSNDPTPSLPEHFGRSAWRGFGPHRQIDSADNRPPHNAESDRAGVDDDLAEQVRVILGNADGPITFIVSGFLGWTAEARRRFFRMLSLHQPFRLQAQGNGIEFASAFEFSLAQMVGPDDAERCWAGRQAAIEAAAMFLPNEIDVACNRIFERLQELGVPDQPPEHLQEAVVALVDDVPVVAAIAVPTRILDVLPTATVAATCVVPTGWTLSIGGVAHGMTLVLYTALVIVHRLVDSDGAELLELSFHRDGVWHRREVAREQVATPQRIIALARAGLPVTSVTARAVVTYLADFERDNHGCIPTVRLTRRTGWHTINEQDQFVMGNRVVMARDGTADGDDQHEQPELIRFRATGDGPTQVTAALGTAGTLAGWLEVMALIAPFPRARFAFYVALVPALLSILGAPNFIVDFCGPTSGGKTTVLRIVASVWGCPDEAANNSLLLNWDTTAAFRHGIGAVLADLPLIIDETRLAGSPEEVIQTVYSVANGRTRGRTGQNGTTSGLSTVLVTSGEVPIVSLTKKGGARARVFSLWGTPFGATTAETASVVRQLNRGLLANYGHAGLAFVQFLVDRPGLWSMWQREYQQLVAVFERRADGDPVVSRMSAALAAISMAARMAHEVEELALPWPYQDVVGLLWDELTSEASDADSSAAALAHAIDWARGHQNQFVGDGRQRSAEARGACAGRWDVDGDWIGFRPEVLRRVLTVGGFEYAAVIRSWRERQWVLLDSSGRKARHRARIGDENCWLIAIRMDAVREVEGPEPNENS